MVVVYNSQQWLQTMGSSTDGGGQLHRSRATFGCGSGGWWRLAAAGDDDDDGSSGWGDDYGVIIVGARGFSSYVLLQ
jgi:hypothetical protein